MGPKGRGQRPVARRVGPTPEESARKWREFADRAAEGWPNPYPTIVIPESILEPQNEALRKALAHERAKKLKAEIDERNNSAKGRKRAAEVISGKTTEKSRLIHALRARNPKITYEQIRDELRRLGIRRGTSIKQIGRYLKK